MTTPASYDLCNYTNAPLTLSSFDTTTGILSLASTDFAELGEQTFEFEITADSRNDSPITFTFSFNFKDPWAASTIIIETDSITPVTVYSIFAGNSANTYLFQLSISAEPTDLTSPELEMIVVNSDGTSLDESLFTFDQGSNEFTISTEDSSHAG